MTMTVFFGIYAAIAGRLVYFGLLEPEGASGPVSRVTASRPDIVDRNGQVLATDIKTASLFAEPRRIVDADEVIEKAVDRAARPPGRADLSQAEERDGFRLAEAAADTEAAVRHHGAWPAQHRVPHREAPLLSWRTDGLAHSGADEYRQQGHCRSGKIHRRPGPRRPAGFRARGGGRSEAGATVDRPARAAHRARRDRAGDGCATTRSRRAPSSSTSRPARCSPCRRCRTSIRTIRSTRSTRTG